ncbi:hypothetical protein AAW01_00675 [Aurantiacibacter gangjinensis]|uniref:Uncharacterized protein n=1 Tax=Aurantiacibacter gangjinensis TaxID=502682 RepID=A0A0G9MPI1_9SPHN|nr:hypothetical protein AAW01_00675 [Aurantiacibacter gangjinensis]
MSAALLASPAAAQDITGFDNEASRDMRAMVGVTIPLGGRTQHGESEPRFDLRFETGESDWHSRAQAQANPLLDHRQELRQGTISLTFEDNPRFLINGTSLVPQSTVLASQDEPLGSGDGPNGGDEPNEPDAVDHIARGALFAGVAVATGVAAIVAAFALSDNDEN